jgi:hypothetical protein
MIDRIIISAIMGVSGWHGLFLDTPQPLMPWQLQEKAKKKSISAMCDRKPKSKEAKDLCRRWKKQQGIL